MQFFCNNYAYSHPADVSWAIHIITNSIIEIIGFFLVPKILVLSHCTFVSWANWSLKNLNPITVHINVKKYRILIIRDFRSKKCTLCTISIILIKKIWITTTKLSTKKTRDTRKKYSLSQIFFGNPMYIDMFCMYKTRGKYTCW